PVGIRPRLVIEESEYLLTIPWGDREISVFIALDVLAKDYRCPVLSAKKVLDETTPYAQAVIHSAAPRASESGLRSSIPAHSLHIEKPRLDVDPNDREMPWPNHKIGGRPVFLDAGSDLAEVADDILMRGYDHVIQLCFPDDRDTSLSVNWPF